MADGPESVRPAWYSVLGWEGGGFPYSLVLFVKLLLAWLVMS